MGQTNHRGHTSPDDALTLADGLLKKIALDYGLTPDAILPDLCRHLSYPTPEHGAAACRYVVDHHDRLTVSRLRAAISATAPRSIRPEHRIENPGRSIPKISGATRRRTRKGTPQ